MYQEEIPKSEMSVSTAVENSVKVGNQSKSNERHWPYKGLPWWLRGKESTCQCRRCGFDRWVGKIPWRRKWQSTLAVLSGEFHGQRSLVSYSPWGHKEWDMTSMQAGLWHSYILKCRQYSKSRVFLKTYKCSRLTGLVPLHLSHVLSGNKYLGYQASH